MKEPGASQFQADEGVQHRDERHGSHEEHQSRYLEGMLHVFRRDGAQDDVSTVLGFTLQDAELDGLRYGQAERHQPDNHHQTHGSRQLQAPISTVKKLND